MRKLVVGLLGVTLAAGGVAFGPSAFAESSAKAPVAAGSEKEATPTDDLPNPLNEKRSELREQAIAGVLSGRLKPEMRNGSKVVKVGETATAKTSKSAAKSESQYVELERQATDRIFVIL
ncbi:MAG TPA: protease, partial [Micromonosporaceae bacterium]